MSILIDHCVPRKFLRLVREWGYDASILTAHIVPDSSDPNVIQLAQNLDAVLLTVDMDFSNNLDYPPEAYQGIIVMRYQAQDEEAISSVLRQVLEDLYRDRLRGALIVIRTNGYRVRRS